MRNAAISFIALLLPFTASAAVDCTLTPFGQSICFGRGGRMSRHDGMYSRFKGLFLAAIAIGMIPATSNAGEAGASPFKTVMFFSNGIVLVHTDGARTNVPGCATQTSRFAIDSTSAAGKSQLAGILAAYAIGKPVVIYGTNSCALVGDTETISYFSTID